MSIKPMLGVPEWPGSVVAPSSLVVVAAIFLWCGSDEAGNRESGAVGGGRRADEAAAETAEAGDEEDDTSGGTDKDPDDVGNTFDVVLVMAAMGAGGGLGMPSPLAVEGAKKPGHMSRIEMKSWTCLVRWGTRESASATRRPSRVAVLYVCGCLRAAEA